MKNTKNTINNQTQLLNFFNNHSTMSLEENDNTKSKTPKEKLVYSIQKEIDILNDRNDLTLIQLSKKGFMLFKFMYIIPSILYGDLSINSFIFTEESHKSG